MRAHGDGHTTELVWHASTLFLVFLRPALNMERERCQERGRRYALSERLQFYLFMYFLTDLKIILTEKMQREIPVITVVPVMGTTEEGAVDPLTEILALKDEFRKQVSWRLHVSYSKNLNSKTFIFCKFHHKMSD